MAAGQDAAQKCIALASKLLREDRLDWASVYFSAVTALRGATDSQKFASRFNAYELAERAAYRYWGCTAPELAADVLRQEAVCKAIADAVPGKKVLLLGSALGVYLHAASQAGATRILCCEGNALGKTGSAGLKAEHGLENVDIIDRPLGQVEFDANPQFEVVVVAELLWGSMISPSRLQAIRNAASFIAPDAKVIPESIAFWAQAAESNTMCGFNEVALAEFKEASGLDYASYNLKSRRSRRVCHWWKPDRHKALSDPCEVLSIDLRSVLQASSDLPLNAVEAKLVMRQSGVLGGIVTWMSMQLPGEVPPISWGPGSPDITTWQYVHYLEGGTRAVDVGEVADVSLELTRDGLRQSGVCAPGDADSLTPYHTDMLNDGERTLAYRRGIALAIQELERRASDSSSPVTVLDIGSGTGLLSFFAASVGATVCAIEREEHTVAISRSIMEDNVEALAKGQVQLICTKSSDLTAEDLPFRPRLLISEIFGTDPLAENILPILKHATEQLAGSDSVPVAVLPCRCRLWGALARVHPAWQVRTRSMVSCGVDVGKLWAPLESGTLLVDLRRDFPDVELHTEPEILATHSFTPPIQLEGAGDSTLVLLPKATPLHELLPIPAPETRSESLKQEALCFVLWWDADCTIEPSEDASTRVSTSPAVARGLAWTQFVQILRPQDIGDGVLEAVDLRSGSLNVHVSWKVNRTTYRVDVLGAGHSGKAEPGSNGSASSKSAD